MKISSKKLKLYFSILLVLGWMVLIFHLSSQPATESNELSKGVTEVIVETVERVAPEKAANLDLQAFNRFLRKKAHFLLYFVLGMLVMNALIQAGYNSIWLAILICVLYAISDEVHQTFVPGRGGMISDVILDSLGAAIGIWVYLSFRKRLIKWVCL